MNKAIIIDLKDLKNIVNSFNDREENLTKHISFYVNGLSLEVNRG